jgi:hypothetical protein
MQQQAIKEAHLLQQARHDGVRGAKDIDALKRQLRDGIITFKVYKAALAKLEAARQRLR